MPGKLLLMILTVAVAIAGMEPKRGTSPTQRSPRPLKVRITRPLLWKNGCLQVSIDRVNRSSNPLFLPAMGLYIASSATLAVTMSRERHKVEWFLVYGASDVLIISAAPLAPGGTEHDDTCVGPTFAVTNTKKKTRREVPLRGKLRIYAYYYLSKQDWLAHKSQSEETSRTAPSK